MAKELLAKKHHVKGSTTSPEKLEILTSAGIDPFLLSVSSQGISGDITGFLANSELLIINIPPGLRRDPDRDFARAIQHLIERIEPSGIKRVIFISSTSVYEDTSRVPAYTETDVANGTSKVAKQLITCEKVVQGNSNLFSCIVRFGGLIGADRHPVKFLSGRKELSNAMSPVNLIHQKDCTGIIIKLVSTGNAVGIFNAVYPEHPPKRDYYIKKAQEAGLTLPEFDEASPSKGKVIRSGRIGEELGYKFQQDIW